MRCGEGAAEPRPGEVLSDRKTPRRDLPAELEGKMSSLLGSAEGSVPQLLAGELFAHVELRIRA